MQTRTYQFYSTASQNAAVTRQIIAPGYIHGVCWSISANLEANNDVINAELSFQSVMGMNTDNAQGIIDQISAWNNLVTSGMTISNLNKVCMGMYFPLGVGQIIYLNTLITGAAQIRASLHVVER